MSDNSSTEWKVKYLIPHDDNLYLKFAGKFVLGLQTLQLHQRKKNIFQYWTTQKLKLMSGFLFKKSNIWEKMNFYSLKKLTFQQTTTKFKLLVIYCKEFITVKFAAFKRRIVRGNSNFKDFLDCWKL